MGRAKLCTKVSTDVSTKASTNTKPRDRSIKGQGTWVQLLPASCQLDSGGTWDAWVMFSVSHHVGVTSVDQGDANATDSNLAPVMGGSEAIQQ